MRFRKKEKREDYRTTRTECDRCHQDIRRGGASEIEIKAYVGEYYPEGDSRDVQEVDCCLECWREHAVPTLRAAGFVIQERDAEDFYKNYQEDKS